MGILIDAWNADPDHHQSALNRYENYLESIRDRLPAAAVEFAEPARQQGQNDRHDAWVEHILIFEPTQGKRRQRRRIDIEIRLLGPLHDGYFVLRYSNVVSYRIDQPNHSEDRHYRRWVGHGDWLIDDIGLSSDGFMVHEAMFRWGGKLYIECEDFAYEWQPGGYSPETLVLDEDVPNRLGDSDRT